MSVFQRKKLKIQIFLASGQVQISKHCKGMIFARIPTEDAKLPITNLEKHLITNLSLANSAENKYARDANQDFSCMRPNGPLFAAVGGHLPISVDFEKII